MHWILGACRGAAFVPFALGGTADSNCCWICSDGTCSAAPSWSPWRPWRANTVRSGQCPTSDPPKDGFAAANLRPLTSDLWTATPPLTSRWSHATALIYNCGPTTPPTFATLNPHPGLQISDVRCQTSDFCLSAAAPLRSDLRFSCQTSDIRHQNVRDADFTDFLWWQRCPLRFGGFMNRRKRRKRRL